MLLIIWLIICIFSYTNNDDNYTNVINFKEHVESELMLSQNFRSEQDTTISNQTISKKHVLTPISYRKNKATSANLNFQIIIDDKYESNSIINTRFTDNNLSNDQSYLIKVQKEFLFSDITFNFSEKTGAVKIDSNVKIRIEKCIFIKCVTNEGKGNAIHISGPNTISNSDSTEISYETVIDSNIFRDCGLGTGFVIFIGHENKTSLLINNTFDFTDESKSCRCIKIKRNANITVKNCTFNKARSSEYEGTIFYHQKSQTSHWSFLNN